jgi:mono/diheme cytochrome c family protein
MSDYKRFIAILAFASATMQLAHAETPQEILNGFEQQAKSESADFQGFDAARGELFFNNTHGNDWSCASCHTRNPADPGKHAKTDKPIGPMAPSANAERFTDPKKVAKWFKRNCGDVLDRECTSLEKGDVLTYLLSIK